VCVGVCLGGWVYAGVCGRARVWVCECVCWRVCVCVCM